MPSKGVPYVAAMLDPQRVFAALEQMVQSGETTWTALAKRIGLGKSRSTIYRWQTGERITGGIEARLRKCFGHEWADALGIVTNKQQTQQAQRIDSADLDKTGRGGGRVEEATGSTAPTIQSSASTPVPSEVAVSMSPVAKLRNYVNVHVDDPEEAKEMLELLEDARARRRLHRRQQSDNHTTRRGR
jgi:hypothetical protein